MRQLLKSIDAMSHRPINNYVLPGLTSSLVGGDGHGIVRLLTASRVTREHVTPHSHRFNFTCLVLDGWVENTTYTINNGTWIGDQYFRSVLSPIDNGQGNYTVSDIDGPIKYVSDMKRYEEGETYHMNANEIHSIRFDCGTRVLFFEEPATLPSSVILEPSVDGERIPTFKTEDWMFQK